MKKTWNPPTTSFISVDFCWIVCHLWFFLSKWEKGNVDFIFVHSAVFFFNVRYSYFKNVKIYKGQNHARKDLWETLLSDDLKTNQMKLTKHETKYLINKFKTGSAINHPETDNWYFHPYIVAH